MATSLAANFLISLTVDEKVNKTNNGLWKEQGRGARARQEGLEDRGVNYSESTT